MGEIPLSHYFTEQEKNKTVSKYTQPYSYCKVLQLFVIILTTSEAHGSKVDGVTVVAIRSVFMLIEHALLGGVVGILERLETLYTPEISVSQLPKIRLKYRLL